MINFDKIYKEYKQAIFKFTYNYTKDINEQEELVQDIFYNIFIALKNFKSRSSIKTYIYSIARNRCIEFIKNKIRERKKISKIIRLYEDKVQESIQEKFIMTEDIKYFLSIIGKLPENYREIYYLAEVQNLKYKEVSDILKIPEGTVKSRLNRAKEKILEMINDKEASNEKDSNK
jgi:RNA polymerase sigma-70 factor, ECF subfamily